MDRDGRIIATQEFVEYLRRERLVTLNLASDFSPTAVLAIPSPDYRVSEMTLGFAAYTEAAALPLGGGEYAPDAGLPVPEPDYP